MVPSGKGLLQVSKTVSFSNRVEGVRGTMGKMGLHAGPKRVVLQQRGKD